MESAHYRGWLQPPAGQCQVLTLRRLTQESGMPEGVSKAGISRSAKSTAFRSSPSRYPARDTAPSD